MLELAETVHVCVLSLEGPGLMPERFTVCVVASSKIVKFAMEFIVGESFTELMVSRNELLDETIPSLTEIVIVLVPKRFAREEMVAV